MMGLLRCGRRLDVLALAYGRFIYLWVMEYGWSRQRLEEWWLLEESFW